MSSSAKAPPPTASPVPLLGIAGLLLTVSLLSALRLHPVHYEIQARRPDADDLLARLLGDGRRLFANHFYVKADAYFHSGFYPTIFDDRQSHQTAHIAEDAGLVEGKNTGDEEQFLGAVANWVDGHGRKHFPSVHTHLDNDAPQAAGGAEREILPWITLSSKLDPNLVENYSVGAFWLRKLGKYAEAEHFVRKGLEANPGNPELLFELGRCRLDLKDTLRARNIWEMAWEAWKKRDGSKDAAEQNRFTVNQILMHLALAEFRLHKQEDCLRWLEVAVPLSVSPEAIRKRISEVKAGQPFEAIDPPNAAGEASDHDHDHSAHDHDHDHPHPPAAKP